MDEAFSKQGSEIRNQLIYPSVEVLEYSFRLGFSASNNVAEYKPLISNLRLAKMVGARNVNVLCESKLVANEFSGDFDTRDECMSNYIIVVHDLTKQFELTRVPQGKNTIAGTLAKLAST